MKKNAEVFVKHILDEIEKINDSLRNITKEKFMDNLLLKDATIRRLEVIGEAVKNLPADYRSKKKEVPWKDIAGMRDKLMHHYFGIDYELVWRVINEEIPKLRKSLRK